MSAIKTIKTNITDAECLKAAALELKLRVSEKTGVYYDYYTQGQSRPWVYDLDQEIMYTIHVVREKDGTLSFKSDGDRTRYNVDRVVGKEYGKLKQLYAVQLARKQIRAQKYRGLVRQSTLDNGCIVLKVGV